MMLLLKDLYGVPVLLEEEDDKLIVVVDRFGKIEKVRLKKNMPELKSILVKKIEEGVICAEDIVMFFS